MTISRFRRFVANSLIALCWSGAASAQTFGERGFVEGQAVLFPQTAPNDSTRLVGDVLARAEFFYKPSRWLQFAGGLDVRANSHDQVEDAWRVDFRDCGIQRPPLAVRRLSATISRGALVVDAGKQFIRWGKT